MLVGPAADAFLLAMFFPACRINRLATCSASVTNGVGKTFHCRDESNVMVDDADLIRRFVACFTRLDDSTFSHDQPPPQKLSAGIDPNNWNSIRWQPAAISTASHARRADPPRRCAATFIRTTRSFVPLA